MLLDMTTTARSEPDPVVDPPALRGFRRAAGLTQRELAQAAGCSLSWIANAEGGYIPRTSDTLKRVLEALKVETPALDTPRSPKADGAGPRGAG